MMMPISRRGFLAASASAALLPLVPARVRAATAPDRTLVAEPRTIEVQGRAATVFGLRNAQGRSGLVIEPGERMAFTLTNALPEATSIHWHGQLPPHAQDGVPDMPAPALAPGEGREYDFAARPGTHWMHSHLPLQEMRLLAAPLIVRRPGDAAADRQEVVVLLHDFSFAAPEEVLAGAGQGGGHDMGHDMGAMGGMAPMAQGMDMSGMTGMAMDLNDIAFDAYLANDRTLDDPEVVTVDKGGRVLVRVINGSAATVFWIDTGALGGVLLAVDGEPVVPLAGRRFGVAMGQRLDVEVTVPPEGGAFPILALREGAAERAGIVLATPGAHVERLAVIGDAAAPAFDYGLEQESRLRAVAPLADRVATRQQTLTLGGMMQPYRWTIDGRGWGEHLPVEARSGERVEIGFRNMSMMGHPMHLHGHAFQVVGIGAQRFAGAVRDTVHVPPMALVTVALDAGEAARWMLHCHHMPHLASGMMTEFRVSA